jgi:hypothetical protein
MAHAVRDARFAQQVHFRHAELQCVVAENVRASRRPGNACSLLEEVLPERRANHSWSVLVGMSPF